MTLPYICKIYEPFNRNTWKHIFLYVHMVGQTTDIAAAYNSFIIIQSITSVRIFSAYLYINSTSELTSTYLHVVN